MKKIFLIGTILVLLLALNVSVFAGGCGCSGCGCGGCDVLNGTGTSKACVNHCMDADDYSGCLVECMDNGGPHAEAAPTCSFVAV